MARPASYITTKEFKSFKKEVEKGFKSIASDLTKALKSLNTTLKPRKKKAA